MLLVSLGVGGILARMQRVEVELAHRGYPVLVGWGARHELATVLGDDVDRVAVITQANIPWTVDPDRQHVTITIPDSEQAAKRLCVIEDVCSAMASAGITRADAVVVVGGGVVTDVGGFAAAVYHRGIRLVSVATTLLSQVDAAIGGKTGVNLNEGKNLVGSFWQPSAVLCDTATLATLPEDEFRCGIGELAKYHFVRGESFAEASLERLESHPLQFDSAEMELIVAAGVRTKAELVAADEREGGRRVLLNYGHTLAHAIETVGGYGLRHGEAVAIGIAYAAEVAHRLGRIGDDRLAEHYRVLAAYRLSTILPAGLGDDDLLALFARDKKAVQGITLVLDGPNGLEPVVGVDPRILRDCLAVLR